MEVGLYLSMVCFWLPGWMICNAILCVSHELISGSCTRIYVLSIALDSLRLCLSGLYPERAFHVAPSNNETRLRGSEEMRRRFLFGSDWVFSIRFECPSISREIHFWVFSSLSHKREESLRPNYPLTIFSVPQNSIVNIFKCWKAIGAWYVLTLCHMTSVSSFGRNR
jgi:hypothetical protein